MRKILDAKSPYKLSVLCRLHKISKGVLYSSPDGSDRKWIAIMLIKVKLVPLIITHFGVCKAVEIESRTFEHSMRTILFPNRWFGVNIHFLHPVVVISMCKDAEIPSYTIYCV